MIIFEKESMYAVLKEIYDELGIYPVELDNTTDIEYIEFNTYERLVNKKLFLIDLTKYYQFIPILSAMEFIYDIDLPTEYPIGTLNNDTKDIAYTIKSIIYNYILSITNLSIIWKIGEPTIHVPKQFIK